MATLSKLKKSATAAKNTSPVAARKAASPPSIDDASAITDNPPRDKPEEWVFLQFRVPASMGDEFAAIAARDFGTKHGFKMKLFKRMFEAYKDSTATNS